MSEIVVVVTGATGPSGSGNSALDDLTDVTITAAASGDILRHNGTAWVDAVGTTHFEVAGAAATAQAAAEATASAALSAHTGDTVDAHDASAISFVAGGTIAGTDVQTAVAEVATDAAAALASHEADSTSVHGIADTSALVTTARTISTTTPLSGGGALSSNLTLSVGAASDTASGVVELATTAETTTGTDTARAVTPAGLLNATTASNINARVAVKKAGTLTAARRGINFIEGSGVTITTADDSGNEEVDVTIAASGGGASMGIGFPSRSAYYSHGFALKWTATESYNWATGFLCAYPVVVGRSCSIDRIGTAVTTAVASATMWVGIYNPDGTAGAPGTLVSGAVSAELSCATTGTKETTISVTLSPGVYWFVSQTGATAGHRTRTAAATEHAAIPTVDGDASNYVIYTTRTAAVLPSDLTATTFGTYSRTELPHGVMVRFA